MTKLTTTVTSQKLEEQFQKDSFSQKTSEQSKQEDGEEYVYNPYEEPVLYCETTPSSEAIPSASIAKAEDCSETEYESFEEEEGEDLDIRDGKNDNNFGYQDNRQTRDVPLPQAKKIPSKELNLLSRLPNVHHSGPLYQKGLLSWLKRFCIISDSRLLTFRSRKHLRPLVILDLIGCDVESIVRESSKYKHALKISRPTPGEGQMNLGPLSSSIHSSVTNSSSTGSDTSTCWFYARDKETIDGWMLHLCLSGCLKASNNEDREYTTTDNVVADTDSGLCASTSDNQTGISGGSSEGSSGDGVTTGLTANGLETKPTHFKKKSKIGESLQSLIWGQFGKIRKDDKDDKIRRAFMEAGGMDAEVSHLAGYININREISEGQARWTKKFCVARQGRLDCYRDPLYENIESTIPLKNSVVVDVDKQNKRICLSCEAQSRERVEVNLELFNATDFSKWLVLIYREADKISSPEGLYNEVYDWKVYSTANDCQPPPLPKERPQSKPSSTNNQPDLELTDDSIIYEYYNSRTLSSIAEDSFLASDFMNKDDSFRLEEIMASAFDDIKRTLYERAVEEPSMTKPSSPSSKSVITSSSAQLPTIPSSFSPSTFSSPLKETNKSLRVDRPSRSPFHLTVSNASPSTTTSSSSSSSQLKSPHKPVPPFRMRSEAVSKAVPVTDSTDNAPTKTSIRSSSVPRTNVILNALDNKNCISTSDHKTSENVTTVSRNISIQPSFDFSLIKNELNKRHSVFNYSLNSIASSATPTIALSSSNNFGKNINDSRDDNIYLKSDKVAGSFIMGRESPKVHTSKFTTISSTVKVGNVVSTTSSAAHVTIGLTSSSFNPVPVIASLSVCSSSLAAMTLVSKAKMSASPITSALNTSLTTVRTSSAALSQPSSSSSRMILPTSSLSLVPSSSSSQSKSSAVTKLSSKTASPILSTYVSRRLNPSVVDLRVVAASNRAGAEATNSDPLGKRASFIALSALSTSNSKLREARAEIRKSSLELMSILPNTSSKMAIEKTLSVPIATSSASNNYVVS